MSNNTNKIIQSLVFIASKMEDKTVDVMKAYKLLWLADRCHLRMYGRTITGDKYYALPMGLVPTDAKHILDGVKTRMETPADYFDRWIEKRDLHKYTAIAPPDMDEFSESDIEVLEKVLTLYGGYSRHELSKLSHKYPEWRQYEDMLKDEHRANAFPINIDLMFENSEEDNSELFNQSDEVLAITKELYHEFNR